jgi:penicillin-insensitive murein DD-endopeptidase
VSAPAPQLFGTRLGFPSSLGLAALGLLGCFGTPTPLAPGLAGSVGWPHHGVQTGAIELPESGPGFVRYRKTGGYYWAQPGLVRAIAEAALEVDRSMPGGAPLSVGDLSAREGGKIARHYSHRNGRDVDLLWYVTTPEGVSLDNPYFVRLGSDGLGRAPNRRASNGALLAGERRAEYVRLDVARQWRLIKNLLSSTQIEVQWLFASSAVEALLIQHALATDDDPELIWRAQNVMLEPADSLPHDDHLHLRVACSPEAGVQGCEGGGVYWKWLPSPPVLADSDALADSDMFGLEPL